jgi:hypothetical protein
VGDVDVTWCYALEGQKSVGDVRASGPFAELFVWF